MKSILAPLAVLLAAASPALADDHADDGDAMKKEAMMKDGGALHEGSWSDKEYSASGTWSIYEKDGKTYVTLSDDFRTQNAPDLKIFLSPNTPDAVNSKNATNGSVLVAELDSNRGGQTYEIPAGTDLSEYKSIVIHCERFSKLWTAAPLG